MEIAGPIALVRALISLIKPAKAHWTDPTWQVVRSKTQGALRLNLVVKWSVRGSGTVQGLECAVRDPTWTWHRVPYPTGTLAIPKDHLRTNIDLATGRPFSASVASPSSIGKPVQDLTSRATPGRYKLRIRWYEPDSPKKRRQTKFSHTVKRAAIEK